MPDIFYEDLEPGTVTEYGRYAVERDEMVGFARDFDPQPFHIDEAAAATTPVGHLIASGWYSTGIFMRLMCEGWLNRAASLGGPGIESLRWVKPVVAGDTLTLRQTVLDKRVSAKRPGMGIVRFEAELLGGPDDVRMTIRHLGMVGLRGASPGAPALPPDSLGSGAVPDPVYPEEDVAAAPRVYEEVEPGRGYDLGTYTFTAERIRAFAGRYDTQRFHLDDEAAARGPFGALAASGWHTAAAWMSRFVARQKRVAAAGGPTQTGVSPGFSDLRWLRPVYVGDVVRYGSEPVAKRPLASKPGWGLVTSRNTGWNARGEKVFEFDGNGFWRMRGA